MQAVVRIAGNQYLVSPGEEILVNHLEDPAVSLSNPEVLLLIDGESIQVGTPSVTGVNIKTKVLGDVKGDKIRVATFKAKSRFRKTRGFRPLYTRIEIEDISTGLPPVSKQSKPRTKKVVKQ